MSAAEPTLIHLDPSKILLADNARFSPEISREDAESMRASILDVGRIMEPVGVTALDSPVKGFTHQLRYGFRRVAGAALANQDGAGILVPALVLEETDPAGVLKEQVAENVARKSLSLMDIAVSARKMLDAGISRAEVRTTFGRTNAWLNMVLALLDLPKTIQARVHTGNIGIAAAYRLCKAPADKRQAILDAADRDNKTLQEIEEKEEAEYAKIESKIAEAEQTLQKVATDEDIVKAEIDLAQKAMADAEVALHDAHDKLETAKKNAKAAEEGKEQDRAKKALERAMRGVKEADAKFREATKTYETEQKKLKKIEDAKESTKTRAEQLKAELAQKRDAPAPKIKKAKLSPQAVDKAAKAEGVDTKVKLTGPEMRKTIEDLSMVASYTTVAAIGGIIKDCFDGTITEGTMVKKLAVLVGDKAPATKKVS